MELKGKLDQSLVNGLLNNSSSMNHLSLPDIILWKLTLSEEKCSSETTNETNTVKRII